MIILPHTSFVASARFFTERTLHFALDLVMVVLDSFLQQDKSIVRYRAYDVSQPIANDLFLPARATHGHNFRHLGERRVRQLFLGRFEFILARTVCYADLFL